MYEKQMKQIGLIAEKNKLKRQQKVPKSSLYYGLVSLTKQKAVDNTRIPEDKGTTIL